MGYAWFTLLTDEQNVGHQNWNTENIDSGQDISDIFD